MKVGDSLLVCMPRKGFVAAQIINIINANNGTYLILYTYNKLHKFFMSIKSKNTPKEYSIEYISTYQGLYTPNLHY